MDRYRFILAIVLSLVVLIGWQVVMYRYFPPAAKKPATNLQPEPQQPPAAPNRQSAKTSEPPASVALPKADSKAPGPAPVAQTVQVPAREITVQTRYWTVRLSNRGAVVTSWILERERREDGSEPEIHAADNGKLELVSQQALDKVGAPLRLRMPWSPEVAAKLNEVNFRIEGVDQNQTTFTLNKGDAPLRIGFTYSSQETVARKTFTFYGDRFVFDATAEVTQSGEPQPVQLVIGPRFGDQSDKQIGSYSTPPQVVAENKMGKMERYPGPRITPSFGKIKSIDHANQRIEIDSPLASDIDQIKIVSGDSGTFIGYARVVSREPGSRSLVLDSVPQEARQGDRVAQATDTVRHGYRWAGAVDHYFAMVAVPGAPVDELVLTNIQIKPSPEVEKLQDYPSVAVPMHSGSVTQFFVGPKDRVLLAQAGPEVGANLTSLIDYGMFEFAIRPLIPVIGVALNWSARLFRNYGWGIVLVTLVINLGLSPLRFYSSKKMKKAAKHQPRIKQLQERMKKLKENPKKNEREIEQLQREQVEIMREANPLGGCLPLLLQMPIFWAFFVYLTISLDVRHAGWILWVKDLSTPDPYKILPIIMCATMIGSTMLQPMPPTTDPSQKMQRVMMTWVMPLILTWFFFFSAPSGLVLYWMVSNVVGVAIQLTINRLTTEPSAGEGGAKELEPATPGKKGKSRERERFPRKRSSEA